MQEEHTLEQRAATYLAQRCGSKGHGEDQGWEKGTLTQDKDRGQGASLSLLDHLQGSVLSTLRFALRFSTPARISTTLKARFLDQPQGEVHHVESYFTYQIWLNCLTILPNAEISYHFVTRVHQCDLNSPDLDIAV